MNSNYMQYMSNPKAFTLKKWFAELLKDGYQPHDNTIERIANSLVTQQDLEDFGKLIATVFEKGYHRAVSDYQEQAKAHGLSIKVVHQNQSS